MKKRFLIGYSATKAVVQIACLFIAAEAVVVCPTLAFVILLIAQLQNVIDAVKELIQVVAEDE